MILETNKERASLSPEAEAFYQELLKERFGNATRERYEIPVKEDKPQ